MRLPFLWVYLTAALLLLIVFWLIGLTTESVAFGTVCWALSVTALTANFLQTHTHQSWLQGLGVLIWLGGLLITVFILAGDFSLNVLSMGAPDLSWVFLISIVAVLVSFLVGRWWGQFYAAVSFLVVPVLSLFGLIVPLLANMEIVLGFIAALVLGLFLVSAESLLVRWQKGQLMQITPHLLLQYCWRLAVFTSALVLTVGLLLVPPATLLRTPLSQRLLHLSVLQPFVQYWNDRGTSFPDLFTMPGGPIHLPDIILYRVQGTTYPRWRVRTYVHYIGSGWRVSNFLESPQPPKTYRVIGSGLELVWASPPKHPASPPLITATVTSLSGRLTELPVPGVAMEVQFPSVNQFAFRTASGCLTFASPLATDRYTVTAQIIPDLLPHLYHDPPLSQQDRQLLTAFPPYLWRIRQLAEQITQGLTAPYSKAKALEGFLRDHYDYSDNPPMVTERNTDVVSFFLFEAREGACDWFASALALMCRAVGIPARVVTGFYSDEVSDGDLIIRANGAHAWVEAYMDGHGWVTLDATPGGPPRNRPTLLARIQRWFNRHYRASLINPYLVWWLVAILWGASLLPLVTQGTYRLWHHYRPKPHWQTVVGYYLTAVNLALRLGLPLDRNATPWENAHRCAGVPRFPVTGKQAFQSLADLTVFVLYAQKEVTDAMLHQAKAALTAFRRQARLYARWFVKSRLSSQTLQQWWEQW